jgi:predicted RecA/RadA family phage recombinase
MQAQRVQEGRYIDHTPNANVDPGTVIVRGNLVCVADGYLEANKLGAVSVEGLFRVRKTQPAIADGATIHWNPTGNPQGGTAGSGAANSGGFGTAMGIAVGAAAADATHVTVRMTGSPATTIMGPLTNLVTDPGNAGAIPVTATGTVLLVSGATAETRTLAIPTITGTKLAISHKTRGASGNVVLTVASAVNQAGNNTLTFDAQGDTIELLAVEVGAARAWRVVGNDGVGLTTV